MCLFYLEIKGLFPSLLIYSYRNLPRTCIIILWQISSAKRRRDMRVRVMIRGKKSVNMKLKQTHNNKQTISPGHSEYGGLCLEFCRAIFISEIGFWLLLPLFLIVVVGTDPHFSSSSSSRPFRFLSYRWIFRRRKEKCKNKKRKRVGELISSFGRKNKSNTNIIAIYTYITRAIQLYRNYSFSYISENTIRRIFCDIENWGWSEKIVRGEYAFLVSLEADRENSFYANVLCASAFFFLMEKLLYIVFSVWYV